ncbi:MAG: ABC transporter substrate-binding protein [bacterium]
MRLVSGAILLILVSLTSIWGQTPGYYYGGEITLAALGSDAALSLNPILAKDRSSFDVIGMIFDGLISIDDNATAVPALATKWESSAEGRVWTFYLRKDVRFHDGREFTSADVVFTFDKILDPSIRSPHASQYGVLDGWKAKDKYTVEFRLRYPYDPFLLLMNQPIVPKHLLERVKDWQSAPFNRSPVGTGPYIFERWVPGDRIVLRANRSYWGGRPNIDRITVKAFATMEEMVEGLKIGSVDFIPTMSPRNFDALKGSVDIETAKYETFSMDFIAFNFRQGLPFQDREVRQALCYAIDRRALVESVLGGQGRVINGPIPPFSWAYNKKLDEIYPYDVDKAKAMLEAEGWKDSDGDGVLDYYGRPFRFTLITNSGNERRIAVASRILEDWKRVGVDVSLKLVDWKELVENYIIGRKEPFDALLTGFDNIISPDGYWLFHSAAIEEGLNFISFRDPRVDRLLEESRYNIPIVKDGEGKGSEENPRKALYDEYQLVIASELPYIFLYTRFEMVGYSKRLFIPAIGSGGPYLRIKDWYINKRVGKSKS